VTDNEIGATAVIVFVCVMLLIGCLLFRAHELGRLGCVENEVLGPTLSTPDGGC